MAPHSSTLAWKIPWMEEPCRLPLCSDCFDYLWRRGLFSLMCFLGEKRYSPGLRQKPWSPKQSVQVTQEMSEWYFLMLDLSYAQPQLQRTKRNCCIWKALKLDEARKMKERELLLHFMYGKIGFAILTVLCAFAGGCILSSLGKVWLSAAK